MKKSRGRQRMNALNQRKSQHIRKESKEQLIKLRNKCGIKDPTPFEAVGNLVRSQSEMKAG